MATGHGNGFRMREARERSHRLLQAPMRGPRNNLSKDRQAIEPETTKITEHTLSRIQFCRTAGFDRHVTAFLQPSMELSTLIGCVPIDNNLTSGKASKRRKGFERLPNGAIVLELTSAKLGTQERIFGGSQHAANTVRSSHAPAAKLLSLGTFPADLGTALRHDFAG